MDPIEPRWRMISSFSPPVSRRWDRRYPVARFSHRAHDAQPFGSSPSSHGDQYLNHHHSVSDGALSYIGSPSENLQAPHWTPSVQGYDLGEFSTPAGGTRPEIPSYPRSSSRHVTPINSIGSASPSSEFIFPPHGYLGRRSFMSKPVYPLVFRNPVSESGPSAMPETTNGGRATPSDDSRASPAWAGTSMTSSELKLHKALTELQKTVASPGAGMSSRREGFRWSNASSYDFGFDSDTIDISEHIGMEYQRCPTDSIRFQKCGLCERLMWQKSPWSSNRIVRSSDMPVAGVLPCRHVFHADCLEEITPKREIQEPSCPLCLRAENKEGSMAPRSMGQSQGATNPIATEADYVERNQAAPAVPRGGSLIRSRFKKQFPFKGKIGKDIFSTKVFRKSWPSSSTSRDRRDHSVQSRAHHQSLK